MMGRPRILLLLPVLALACAGGSGTGGGKDADAGEGAGEAGDVSIAPGDGGEEAGGPETASREVGEQKDWGDWGKPCTVNADCTSGYCLEIGNGESVCTLLCVEECPSDWECRNVYTPPDWVSICVPPKGDLCEPCNNADDCMYEGDLCIPVGTDGKSYCTSDCSQGPACPEHYSCAAVMNQEGKEIGKQCLPDTGSCVCTFELNLTTKDCEVGNEYGKCPGKQFCDGENGWTACDGEMPGPETCDGTDENCNGKTDEGLEQKPCWSQSEYGKCPGLAACKGAEGYVCDAPEAWEEACDGLDNDCDDFADEGFPDLDGDNLADCVDEDDDGDGVPDDKDCGPTNPKMGKGLTEECDGLDNDCDGVTDEGFPDTDKDGVADCVDKDTDGDGVQDFQDNCPLVANPDQLNSDNDSLGDKCDDDDDNDGIKDDGDASGVAGDHPCTGGKFTGCDDNCPVNPNKSQTDVDGDKIGDECDNDADGDGTPDDQDCAPLDKTIHPGAAEVCNGVDDNCNGEVDEGSPDTDGDKAADCVDADDDGDGDPDENDCAPLDPIVYHGAPEVCDGLDNNCNGSADEGCPAANVGARMLQGLMVGPQQKMIVRFRIGLSAAGTAESKAAGLRLRVH
jgi:hypothetical protein